MKKKFEMNLLNSEEMHSTVGGRSCSQSGDTIWKKCIRLVGDVVIKWCVTYEAGCAGGFVPSCSGNSFSLACKSEFTFKPRT